MSKKNEKQKTISRNKERKGKDAVKNITYTQLKKTLDK